MSAFTACVTVDQRQKPSQVVTPEQILPAGADSTFVVNPYTGESAPARKGIIAATLNNVVLLNKLLTSPESEEKTAQTKEIIEAISDLLPSLSAVGIFHLFSIEEWISNPAQPGRVMVGALYLQRHTNEITENISRKLQKWQTKPLDRLLLIEIRKVIGQ